ncbi:hypothetical protein Tco_1520519, partial [Tanacetum coccineum]
ESEGEEDSWMSLSQAGENDAREEILSYMLNPGSLVLKVLQLA